MNHIQQLAYRIGLVNPEDSPKKHISHFICNSPAQRASQPRKINLCDLSIARKNHTQHSKRMRKQQYEKNKKEKQIQRQKFSVREKRKNTNQVELIKIEDFQKASLSARSQRTVKKNALKMVQEQKEIRNKAINISQNLGDRSVILKNISVELAETRAVSSQARSKLNTTRDLRSSKEYFRNSFLITPTKNKNKQKNLEISEQLTNFSKSLQKSKFDFNDCELGLSFQHSGRKVNKVRVRMSNNKIELVY